MKAKYRDFGRRFRSAVETVLQQMSAIDSDELAAGDLFRAAIQVAMRLVTVMFAEARQLLPVHNEIYRENYSLATLGDRARLAVETAPERLELRFHYWPALCALFKLVYEGSVHETMPMRAYGGDLFSPGDEAGPGVSKALAMLEGGRCTPDDRAVASVLDLLEASSEGLDFFAHLDVQAMGSLYENLLDFRASKVGEHQPLVELAIRDRPVVSVAYLENLSDAQLSMLLECQIADLPAARCKKASETDEVEQSEQRLGQLRRRLTDLGFASGIVTTFLPGQLYLVNDSSGRKEGGVYYTPPEITVPMTKTVLEPLCRNEEGRLKAPSELLSLTVCDPAMGSGAFLVAALNLLTAKVVESLRENRCLEKVEGLDVTLVHLDARVTFELPGAPGEASFDRSLVDHVKRYVVERCIHGVDLDPLTVELARLSLWLETMDSRLPFTFLNHKLKQGNSLVGAWYEDLAQYPMAAWARFSSADAGTGGTVARVKSQARTLRQDETSGVLPFAATRKEVGATHRKLARAMERIHRVPIEFPDRKAGLYQSKVLDRAEGRRLKQWLDSWCTLWFASANAVGEAPGPIDWACGETFPAQVTEDTCRQQGFFHWQQEFPDVFTAVRGGFDAVVGNPPWEVLKCEADSVLMAHDGLYRCYPASTRRQLRQRLKKGAGNHAAEYNARVERHRAQNHWFSNVGNKQRPYLFQGGGDFNTFKLFTEQCHALCSTNGRIGLVLPSGFYSDHGAAKLRKMLFETCQVEWIFGFENRKRIFHIDGRQKFCIVTAQKGKTTKEISTAFLQTRADAFADPQPVAVPYPLALVQTLSPADNALLEVRTGEELQVMHKLSKTGTVLKDLCPSRFRYVREFDMSNRRGLMKPVSLLEERGFRRAPVDLWKHGDRWAAPVYQGSMFRQFEPCVGGNSTPISPRYLMLASDFAQTERAVLDFKVAVRRIARNSDKRTLIAAVVPPLPCGDKAPVLHFANDIEALAVTAVLNSFAADFFARRICSGTNFDRHHLFRIPIPPLALEVQEWLGRLCLELNGTHPLFDPLWQRLGWSRPAVVENETRQRAARIETRARIDAVVGALYGLTKQELEVVLVDCHHPADRLQDRTFAGGLDPRGFWREDKDLDPELRLPARCMWYFEQVEAKGLLPFVQETRKNAGSPQAEPCVQPDLPAYLEALESHRRPGQLPLLARG
jgi:hypothetical protein